MAIKIVDSFPPRTSRGGSKPKYDWASWTDGGMWLLRRNEDFTVTVETMVNNAYVYASRHGLTVRTEVVDRDLLKLQFSR